MGKAEGLSVSRRKFRKLIADNYGKPGEPGGPPWYGEGRFVQHLTPDITTLVGFCGRGVRSINSHPIRTLIGITCPECTGVLKRINRRIEAENKPGKEASAAKEGH